MKKEVFVLSVFLCVCLGASLFLYVSTNSTSPFTGRSTSQSFDVAVVVGTVDLSPTPGSGSSSGGGGGGGGGGATPQTPRKNTIFSLEKERIILKLTPGTTSPESFIVKNTAGRKLVFTLDSSLDNFLHFSETQFELEPGASKSISFDFLVRNDTLPSLYLGDITITAEGINEHILVALEVVSSGALFDVSLYIPDEFLLLKPGERLVVDFNLLEVEDVGKVDVELYYRIVDFTGSVVSESHETLAVDGQLGHIKSFEIPADLPEGDYIFYVQAVYDGKTASAHKSFIVQSTGELSSLNRFYILMGVLGVILILFFRLLYLIYKVFSTSKGRSALRVAHAASQSPVRRK